MPMNTALVRAADSSMLMNWLRMSAASSCPWKPWRPVMQNLQPILHPACDDTQSVFLSSSGIMTDSTNSS